MQLSKKEEIMNKEFKVLVDMINKKLNKPLNKFEVATVKYYYNDGKEENKSIEAIAREVIESIRRFEDKGGWR